MNWIYFAYFLSGLFVGASVVYILVGLRQNRLKEIEQKRFYPTKKVVEAILNHGRFVLGDEEYDLGKDQY